MKMIDYIKVFLEAMRCRQWTKNILLFVAPLFTFQIESFSYLGSTIGFLSFCMISSSIYLFNDILDISLDKKHPTKRFRPIARGEISIVSASLVSLSLAIISILLGSIIGYKFIIVISTYLAIQLAYCLSLKSKPLLDIFCISSGFILRAIAGVISSNLIFSPWFILTIGLLALFLAVEKRKAELRLTKTRGLNTRAVLERYSLPLLLRLESIVGTSAFMSYSLWAAGPSLNGAPTSWMLISVPFVMAGIFRYQLISDPEESKRRIKYIPDLTCENPEEILIRDNGIKLTILGWLACVTSIGISHNLNLLPV